MVKHSQSFQNSKFAMLLQYLKREARYRVDFLHVDKYQRFLQIDAIIFRVCVCVYVVFVCVCVCVWSGIPKLPKIRSLLFFLQYLKEVSGKLIFCMQISMKLFQKLIL